MDRDEIRQGIADEKTRESFAVFRVIFAVLFSLLIGSATEPWLGVVVMLVLFGLIWRAYSHSRPA